MKERVLELLKGMTSDSKKETYKCEKELCEILTDVCNKITTIEKSVIRYIIFCPDKIFKVDSENAYVSIEKLPETIWCNDGNFEFKTEWLDTDYCKSFFEDLKRKSIDIKIKVIKNAEASLNKHKEELESLKKLSYEDL